LDRRRIEASAPGRHDAATSVADAIHDGRLVGRIEPDRVGEIGRAELAIALAVLAMASGAVVGEDLLAGGNVGARGNEAGQRAYEIGDRGDLRVLEHAVAAEGRHAADASFVVARARAMGDGKRDVVELAAP